MIQFVVCFFKNCLQFPVPFLKTSISKSLFPRILLFLGHVHWKCKKQQKRQPTYQQPGLVVTSFCEFFDRWIEVLLEGPHPFPPHLELELGPPPIGLASLRGAMSTRCRFVSLKKHIFVKWKNKPYMTLRCRNPKLSLVRDGKKNVHINLQGNNFNFHINLQMFFLICKYMCLTCGC